MTDAPMPSRAPMPRAHLPTSVRALAPRRREFVNENRDRRAAEFEADVEAGRVPANFRYSPQFLADQIVYERLPGYRVSRQNAASMLDTFTQAPVLERPQPVVVIRDARVVGSYGLPDYLQHWRVSERDPNTNARTPLDHVHRVVVYSSSGSSGNNTPRSRTQTPSR